MCYDDFGGFDEVFRERGDFIEIQGIFEILWCDLG
nr:MAG TPA: hypothetical protein [Caudoviricetes sp.]